MPLRMFPSAAPPSRPLPPEVERHDQQLRGYQYALIGDDVLIVDPGNRQVVDVIE